MQPLLALLLCAVPAVIARGSTYNVQVGPNGQLVYSPEVVRARPGDKVKFHFHPKNHTVTQSSFEEPCKKTNGGFASGFRPVMKEGDRVEPFVVHVKDDKPVWVYCGQTGHCGKGMVFAINPPSDNSDKSFGKFKDKAKASAPPANPPPGNSPPSGSASCPSKDNAGSPLTNSGNQGDKIQCTYQTAGACTYFTNGGFDSGSSQCPANAQQSGGGSPPPGNNNGAAPPAGSGDVQCPPTDNKGNALAKASVSNSGGTFVSCSYNNGPSCTYFFNGNFDSGSSDCPAKGIPQSQPGAKSALSGAIGDDDESGDLHTLIRNTYIAIGLLAAVLLSVISLIFVNCFGRGCMKGKSSAKYGKISNPKGFDPEMKGLHSESRSDVRYSD